MKSKAIEPMDGSVTASMEGTSMESKKSKTVEQENTTFEENERNEPIESQTFELNVRESIQMGSTPCELIESTDIEHESAINIPGKNTTIEQNEINGLMECENLGLMEGTTLIPEAVLSIGSSNSSTFVEPMESTDIEHESETIEPNENLTIEQNEINGFTEAETLDPMEGITLEPEIVLSIGASSSSACIEPIPIKPSPEKQISCNLCSKTFLTMGNLKCHVITDHTGETPYQCPFCTKAFAFQARWRMHLRTHTGEKPFQCPTCDKAFTTRALLRQHVRSHCRQYSCPACGKNFLVKKGFDEHIFRPDNQHGYNQKCCMCERTFKDKGTVKRHLYTHTNERPQQCPVCGKSFKENHCLYRHFETHKDEPMNLVRGNLLQCTACGESFNDKAELDNHVKTDNKKFQCCVCSILIVGKSKLNKHLMEDHQSATTKCPGCGETFNHDKGYRDHFVFLKDMNEYKCCSCEKTYKQKINILARHIFTHTEEKKHMCPQCGKSFKVKQALKQHLVTHTTEDLHQCRACGKTFKNRDSFTLHILSGENENEFRCCSCDRIFKDRGCVRKHLLTHRIDRPHKCNICGAEFKLKKSIEHHLLKHAQKMQISSTDADLLVCPVCEEPFSKHRSDRFTSDENYYCCVCKRLIKDRVQLNWHLQHHTKDRPYQCQTCGQLFTLKQSFKRHMDRGHSNEIHPCPHPFCFKSFKQKQSLDQHLRSHSDHKERIPNKNLKKS